MKTAEEEERLRTIVAEQRKIAPALPIKKRLPKFKRTLSVKQIKRIKKPVIIGRNLKKIEPRIIPLESGRRKPSVMSSSSTNPKPSTTPQHDHKPLPKRPSEKRPVPPPLPKAEKKPSSFREIFAAIPFEPPRRVVPPPYPCWVDGHLRGGCVEVVEFKPTTKSPPPRDEPSGRVSPGWERYYPEHDVTGWDNGSFDQVIVGQLPSITKSEPIDELRDHTYHRLTQGSRSLQHYDPHLYDHYNYLSYQNHRFERPSWACGESVRESKYVPYEQQYGHGLYVGPAQCYPIAGAAGPSYTYDAPYYEVDMPLHLDYGGPFRELHPSLRREL
ncbi:hypothetical protein GCK32_005403 [Trichostrongylus colubriformis]|uniref:Uncharacterized protein n=1 Tax=Trichostrongylus colubriformis TaxID=6319 RepID=A0AAN8IQI6_TRICO